MTDVDPGKMIVIAALLQEKTFLMIKDVLSCSSAARSRSCTLRVVHDRGDAMVSTVMPHVVADDATCVGADDTVDMSWRRTRLLYGRMIGPAGEDDLDDPEKMIGIIRTSSPVAAQPQSHTTGSTQYVVYLKKSACGKMNVLTLLLCAPTS